MLFYYTRTLFQFCYEAAERSPMDGGNNDAWGFPVKKVKLKFALEEAMKAQTGGRCMALLFL